MSRAFFQRFNTRSNEPASPVMGWLAKDPQQLLQTAQRYLQLEQLVQQNLPSGLRHCKVAHIDRQTVVLAVPSAAHANKLRQLTPTLLQRLQQHKWQLNQIQIQIQSVLFTGVKPLGEVRKGGAGIDATGLEAFEQLRKELDAGPLASAVQRLVARHQNKKAESE
ncbi:MAG TPA: DUF721 domain-containing protein [Alcaligenaceae bacterium]|nr:DUF721 domain-containing protein [Alcaligenaceae bacterium]